MPASTVFRSFLEAQELGSRRKAREDEAARLQQERELSQAASAGGIQSLAFQQLVGTNPNLASKIGGLLGDIGIDREVSFFKDARELNNLLKRNKSQDGLAFINSRLDEGDRLAAETGQAFDPKDTLEIRDLILQDRMPEAIELLDSVEQAGIISKVLEDPSASRKGKDKQFETIEVFKQLQELKATGASPEEIKDFRQLAGLDKAVKLSSNSEATLIKAQDASFGANAAVRKMDLLADDISKINIGGGLKSTLTETLKELLGSQDEVSKLRREFRSIRSSQATKNLPPGPASDKDIALALSGFPGENAPAEQIISFLRGQAKLARMDVAFNDFKSDYISENSSVVGFGKAWRRMLQDDSFVSSILGDTTTTTQAPSGFSDEKRARLDELRRKKAARGG